MPPEVSSVAHLDQVAPKFMALTRDVLFGDVWQRSQLTPRERSLVTVAALAALYRLEQLPFHIERAIGNGLQADELAEVFTHLAFYAGWPAAASAIGLLKQATAQSSAPSTPEGGA